MLVSNVFLFLFFTFESMHAYVTAEEGPPRTTPLPLVQLEQKKKKRFLTFYEMVTQFFFWFLLCFCFVIKMKWVIKLSSLFAVFFFLFLFFILFFLGEP